MGKYLKIFLTTASYLEALSNLILPNVSVCEDDLEKVYYNPYVAPLTPVETRLVVKYNVTSTQEPIQLFYSDGSGSGSGSGSGGEPPFSAMEIDGVEQSEVVNEYTFDTVGEHTVKYTLTDPTSISDSAFEYCSGLISVTIPDSVTIIGNSAFSSCSGLSRLNSDIDGVFNLPSGVTSIGNSAFAICSSLTSIDIPNSVTSIGEGAFNICSSLTSIDIPNSVTSIDGSAFANCTSLRSCTIGSGVTSIGYEAFRSCSGLTSIVCNATTAPIISSYTFRGVKTDGTLTVPSGSTGYDVWMGTSDYYLGKYNWTKVEQ